MVELKLDTGDWQAYSKDHYISVRVGEVQKLAKLTGSRTYKFPSSAVASRKYGKVEIFRRVGQAIVCVDPEMAKGSNEVEVCLEGDSKICFEAEVNEPGGAKAAASPKKEKAPASPTSVSQKAAAYLEQHHLEVRLSDAMQAVLRERPEDPATFLANMLLKNANVVAKLPKFPTDSAEAPPPPPAPQRVPEEIEQVAKCAAPVQQASALAPVRSSEPSLPRPADVKNFGSYYQTNFEGGQQPGLYAKFPAAPQPPPMPTSFSAEPLPFLPSSGSFGGCTARFGGTIPFKVKTGAAAAATPAPKPAALAPAPGPTFNKLPSVGSWLTVLPPPSEEPEFVATLEVAVAAKALAPAAAAALAAPEAPAVADVALPIDQTGFMMSNVSALGPCFWGTGMSPGLMF